MNAERELMLKEVAERLKAALEEAKKSRPWDMRAVRLAGRRYLRDFEEAHRQWLRTAKER
ncbi:MAG TPA: hypothetical protein VFE60_03290 [Roseiarcus sp.]|nr:hypothetical protein [Roseiarcus sp.]